MSAHTIHACDAPQSGFRLLADVLFTLTASVGAHNQQAQAKKPTGLILPVANFIFTPA